MARLQHLPPRAASLTESMRDLGYTFETAIADLIDNSIAANANEIDVLLLIEADGPVAAVIDNGSGMTEDELVSAMRHGATSPGEARKPGDLGRFGLGLKTASLSQCRQLSVISKREGLHCGAQWDLDVVEERDDWFISVLDHEDVGTLPFVEQLSHPSGTLVLWRKLDRLSEGQTDVELQKLLDEKLEVLRNHLSLVFHRYLDGEVKGGRPLAIRVNGHALRGFDPFCRSNPATQDFPTEKIAVAGSDVTFTAFVLPHHSKLSKPEYDFYKTRHDFLANQGAYVYRLGRLMAWGDWFRIIPKGEATKLARVLIDFPTALDTHWTIDIKKSRAYPPPVVRERLKQVIRTIVDRSTRVHRQRGRRLFTGQVHPMWVRTATHEGIRYSINAEHPLVELAKKHLPVNMERHLDVLLSVVAKSLPIEMIYADYSSSPHEFDKVDDVDALVSVARDLQQGLAELGIESVEEIVDVMKCLRVTENQLEKMKQVLTEEVQ